MAIPVTASMLYDLVVCPHRVAMDIFTDKTQQDEPNAFVELLWKKGFLHEKKVMKDLDVSFTDLSVFAGDEKEQQTFEAMQRGDLLIYSGRIHIDGLLGEPDLLRKEGDGYVAGDIKSGSGVEGSEDLSKPKKHYGIQLGLYTDILLRKNLSAGKWGFILDRNGYEVVYDFNRTRGKRNTKTLWQEYEDCLFQAQKIIDKQTRTLAAYSSVCNNCHWYSTCLAQLNDADDLTLIPGLGRSKRDVMMSKVSTIHTFAESDPDSFISGKKTIFPGIGPASLQKFHARAKLIAEGASASPYLTQSLTLPVAELELFFDIEVDPLRDICYLHGFVERHDGDNDTEIFVPYLAEKPTEKAEKQAFTQACEYIQKRQPCAIYYYSNYEQIIYQKLQKKYPDVCTVEDLASLFDPAHTVDLYSDVIQKATEWPTHDYSIKTLAKYLGFEWRDTHPSGAASIEWFHKWTETGNMEIRRRILDYNEDDCRATRVLRDALDNLALLP